MYTIERIYTITAFAALLSLLIVMIKFITKRLAKKGLPLFKRLDKKLMRSHKFTGFVLISFGGIHGILTFSRVQEFGVVPYILGGISLICYIASARCFYIKKKFKEPKHWIFHHRIFAFVAVITLIGHIAATR